MAAIMEYKSSGCIREKPKRFVVGFPMRSEKRNVCALVNFLQYGSQYYPCVMGRHRIVARSTSQTS